MTSTRTRLAGLVLLALATLSGCGGLHPGVAAEVGDQSITDAEVDQLAQEVCTAIQAQPDADRAPRPVARGSSLSSRASCCAQWPISWPMTTA